MSGIDADVMSAISDLTGGSSGAAEAEVPVSPDAVFSSAGLDRDKAPAPAARAAAPATGKGEPAGEEPADDDDPLDDKHFTEEALNTPEKRAAARARLFKHLDAVKKMTSKSHHSHAAAVRREKKIEAREQAVGQREAAAAAYDRAFQASLSDLQSGDADRFLTGLHRIANVGDPAGFWRTVSLKLASGGTFTEAEKKTAQADPEIQRRLEQLEGALKGRDAREEEQAAAAHAAQLEQLKTQNLETAKGNATTPRVALYAADPRTAPHVREELARIMLESHKRTGRPLTVGQACAELEESLAVHYELSQRADGKTNGEKGTAGSAPEAGRATSQEPPKPEGLSTIPTQLSAAPVTAVRPMSEAEERTAAIQGLERAGFFSRIGL